ncbi:MAG: hypothetical protein JNM90_07510 [Burkholderiales bacterium]|nr:hypothetical protein [Burkholderiales bacterium]
MDLALVNPQAGGGRAARLVAPLRSALAEGAPGCRLHVAASVADGLGQLAALPRGSRVLVVGGDGTLNRLLPGLLAGDHGLSLLPSGSGNDTARALGLHGMPWRSALEVARSGRERRIDLGEADCDGRTVPFVSSFSAGFDAAVCRRALEGPRFLTGLPRYLLATLREVAALRLHRLRVAVDGIPVHEGEALFAASLNTPSFGSGMPAVPGARIDDGRLDLLLAGRFGRAGALAMLPRLMAGRHLGDARVETRDFARLDLTCDTPLPVAADGEYLGRVTGLRIRVLAHALTVAQP